MGDVPFCIPIAQHQEPLLLFIHLAHGVLKFAHNPFAVSCANGIRSRFLAPATSQIDHGLRELRILVGQPHHACDAALLHRIIDGQIADVRLDLLGATYSVVITAQSSLIAGEHKTAVARIHALHFQPQILQILDDLVRVAHPRVAGGGLGDTAIGNRAHHEQHRNSGAKCSLHRPIRHGLRLHFSPGWKGITIRV